MKDCFVIDDKKEDIKRVQKLVPKEENLTERYAGSDTLQTEWFVTRKSDDTYHMHHIENDKVVKVGKKSVSNPMELSKYVSWSE